MNSDNLVGQVLAGRYRIDELVGQGGVWVVYKAYDSGSKQVVAVKVILTELVEDAGFRMRFEEVVPAVAGLRHPNIVHVLDYGHDGDLYYMVQEFVAGEALQERLRRLNRAGERLSVAEATGFALQISDAAGYIHQQGMLHRDIRPANIIVDLHDEAILMDVGNVKISGGRRHTATSAVINTALYMSPEMIRGEAPDARSDLYSLGVTLFEMVGGRPPFEASSAMTLLMMHLKDAVPDLREVRSDVPAALWTVVSRALAKDREERYRSMADLGRALEEIGKPVQARVASGLQGTEIDLAEIVAEPARIATALDAPGDGIAARPVTAAPRLQTGGQPVAVATRLETGPQAAAAVAATRLEAGVPPVEAAGWPETSLSPVPSPGSAPPPATEPASMRRERTGSLTPMPAGRNSTSGILRKRWVWAVAAILVLALGAGLAFALAGGSDPESTVPADVAALPTPSQGSATPTETTTVPPAGGSEATGHGSPPASQEPAPAAASPISVTISGITLDPEQHYAVNYQVFGLPEVMTTTHLHFFFNTVSFEKAGAPADKTWYTWFGPSPFTGYTAADRPANASQICVQAANPNHTALPGTGSCAPLPDVVLVSSTKGIDGFFGPGTSYPVVAQLQAREKAMVVGLSPDELWWNVVDTGNPDQNYWIYTVDTQVTGDVSKVPLVEGPPPGATPPHAFGVDISGITLDAQGLYVVDFFTEGFVAEYPGGTHIHFYFNTFTADQVGIGGEANRRSHGGPPPFTGFAAADRPEGATELCAVVANPDHTVIADSGDCYPLPGLPKVEITGIAQDAQGLYVADFTATDFSPTYPGGTHIHFYFNTVTADQVGIGGEANRRSHGGPSPFTGFAAADRPDGATELCAVVANPDHTVTADSGNCYPLPGLPTVKITDIRLDAQGLYVADFSATDFSPTYPGGTHIHFYFSTFTADQVGIGGEANRRSHGGPPPFTGYAAADRPEAATELCAVVANPDHTVILNSGNCYHLPDVLGVEITGITVNRQGRYVVEYTLHGFAPGYPGTHVHFFYDTVQPEDVGKPGVPSKYYYGQPPFARYSIAERPAGATKLCALVASPDDTMILGSGNCFVLPD
jgi:hypothetical protein